jgi:hypothetical protein
MSAEELITNDKNILTKNATLQISSNCYTTFPAFSKHAHLKNKNAQQLPNFSRLL